MCLSKHRNAQNNASICQCGLRGFHRGTPDSQSKPNRLAMSASMASVTVVIILSVPFNKILKTKQFQDFFMEFSWQHSCVLSRSALQLLYLSPSPATMANMAQSAVGQPRPHHVFVEMLRESVRSFVNPPNLSPKAPVSSLQVTSGVGRGVWMELWNCALWF